MALFFQILWSGTLFLGLNFAFLGIRIRQNRIFLSFGISVILLCAITAYDVFKDAEAGSVRFHREWFFLRHLIALLAGPVMLLFTMHATGSYRRSALLRLSGWAGIAGLPFLSDLFLGTSLALYMEGTHPNPGILYAPAMLSYILFFLYRINHSLFAGFGIRMAREPLQTWLPLVGWSCIAIGGLTEFAFVFFGESEIISGVFLLLGVSLFAILVSLGLSETYVAAHAKSQSLVSKLDAAYREMRTNVGLAEIGKSATVISHEIRNSLAVIKGNSRLLVTARQAPPGPETLERLSTSMDRLEDFVTGILDYSKASSPMRTETIDIQDLLESAAKEWRRPGCPDLRIIRSSRPVPPLMGDPGILHRAFLNAYNNSREAGARNVEIRIRSAFGKVIVAMEDDGTGCPQGQVGRIFQPFFSTRGQTGGTGLGMPILKAIFESHGGGVSPYSKTDVPSHESGFLLIMILPAKPGSTCCEPGTFKECTIIHATDSDLQRVKRILCMLDIGISAIGLEELRNGFSMDPSKPLLVVGSEAIHCVDSRGTPMPRLSIQVDDHGVARASGIWNPPAKSGIFTEEYLAESILGL